MSYKRNNDEDYNYDFKNNIFTKYKNNQSEDLDICEETIDLKCEKCGCWRWECRCVPCPSGQSGPTGPTGPTGPMGATETFIYTQPSKPA